MQDLKINIHIGESFSIEELAHNVNLHPNYIFELFNKRVIGVSPNAYMNVHIPLQIDQ